MNCLEFQQRLEAAVDERQLPTSKDFTEHAAVCFSCREAWDDFLLLESAIAGWRGKRLDVDLTERVLADFRTMRAEQSVVSEPSAAVTLVRVTESASGLKWWPMLIPAVAALAIAVTVLVNRNGSDEVQLAQSGTTPTVKPEEFADLNEIVDDAKSAWLGLARTTAARTSGLSVFLPSLRSSASDETASPPMEIEMLDDMNPGMAPVPDEFRRAFEFLIDASQWDESQTT